MRSATIRAGEQPDCPKARNDRRGHWRLAAVKCQFDIRIVISILSSNVGPPCGGTAAFAGEMRGCQRLATALRENRGAAIGDVQYDDRDPGGFCLEPPAVLIPRLQPSPNWRTIFPRSVRTCHGVQGIQYDIKKGIERDEWAWVIHTPKCREGRTNGSRDEAVSAAIRYIREWCKRHPADCKPHTIG